MKALLGFLFGKNPDIFDENGQVRHKLGSEKWKAWNDRYKSSLFDWRKHKGVSQKSRKPKH
jgi:hypothetical protein